MALGRKGLSLLFRERVNCVRGVCFTSGRGCVLQGTPLCVLCYVEPHKAVCRS
ncbi:unnamed protein product [Staurois parvus]|uniref:Uncharacterized protein n=1 Tax=Staurois parvus TaxID=386267 RepID=A0ABN9GN80_9NEOB|nr:unnamed protein product [Staurois parvus]